MLRLPHAVRLVVTKRFLLAYLSMTVAYVVTGRLALLLAVPPGYGSPIFPPAGISVAGMLIGGRATLPWTFLGSFLLNLWTDLSAGHEPIATCFVAAVVIAAASMLQAASAEQFCAVLSVIRHLSIMAATCRVFCLCRRLFA